MAHSKSTSATRRIAVVGGGASGALLAIAIADRLQADAHAGRHTPPIAIAMFEPREQLGRGLAYSSPRSEHVLNVPAARVSGVGGKPDDFVEWCRQRDVHAVSHSFIERGRFGEYVTERLGERVGRAPTLALEHVQARVTDIVDAVDDGHVVHTDHGMQRFADDVVLATGYGTAPGDALFTSVESLWAMGPLRRAAEWEATAIPEIRRQAADMAQGLWL